MKKPIKLKTVYRVMIGEMKNIIELEESNDWDPFETTYEKALTIAAAYRILHFYIKPSEFKEYCEERRKHRENQQ